MAQTDVRGYKMNPATPCSVKVYANTLIRHARRLRCQFGTSNAQVVVV